MNEPKRRCFSLLVCLLMVVATGGRAWSHNSGFDEPTEKIIRLDHDIHASGDFVLAEDTTLLVTDDQTIEAAGAIILRGTVRVALPDDAPQAAWAPRLNLIAGEPIVITGPMTFGDGRDGVDEFAMGGSGASLYMEAPLLAIGVNEIRMGHGGRGGPGSEGGAGGSIMFFRWMLAFNPDGLDLVAGHGGDGGDGPTGTKLHPRGFPGGDGGGGGKATQINPMVLCKEKDLPRYEALAIGTDAALDPFLVGPHHALAYPIRVHAGNGGHGGNGGPPFEPFAISGKAGGGRAGDGGAGGDAVGSSGLPGSRVTPADAPPDGIKWTGGLGTPGGNAYGGNGGNTGPGLSLSNFSSAKGGRGGDGGTGWGGCGGTPGEVDPPDRYRYFTGRPGQGGQGFGGSGGQPGKGHHGGDGGDGGQSMAGSPGDAPLPHPPEDK